MAVVLYQGYQYGVSDQSQILPCIWAQDHPGAYAKDHYVQTYLNSPVNERTIFHFMFRYLGYANPWITWLWHAFLSIALFLAWIRIASFFIKNAGFQWLALALVVTLGFHTHTGSNEIYYNSVVPSLAAKALGTWALYYWLTRKQLHCSLLLLAATLLQPLVGLQLFLLTAVATSVDYLLHRKEKTWPWKAIGIYVVLVAPWMYLLIRNNGGGNDPKTFFDIIHFRLSHHFFASAFGWQHLLLGFGFASLAVSFFKEKLRWFFLTAILGCILYEIGVELYQWPIALYTQWWKTTIWIETFAFIALGVYLERLVGSRRILNKYPILIPILFVIAVWVYRLSGLFSYTPEYMFPWAKTLSPEVDISLKAREVTGEDALFILPIQLTAFRWYSKRSNYVDYKAMLHQERFLKEWYARIGNIYQYGIEEQKAGFDIRNFSRYLFEEPSHMSLGYWKKLGITHFISTAPALLDVDLVAHNGKYYIYRLR